MLNERFWSKVDRSTADECWEWTSNKNNKGYGLFKVSAVVGNKLAHRLAYEDAKGRIPVGMLVRHTCDNPACVNPKHLVRGTHKQNVADMDQRKRRVTNTPHGEANCNAILTDAQVIQMRCDYVSGHPIEAICDRYRISRESINDFTSGRSWKHLLGTEGSPTLIELKAEAGRRRRNNARINANIAAEIRKRLSNGELGKNLAAEYGLHKATISDVKLRKIWTD
ncbi:MAG: HNH endonuclease signature motif containing protein [Alphaproteobacteria bacterium]